jgi:hypothetical protein
MSSSDLFQIELPDDFDYDNHNALKYATLEHHMVTIERGDDCRCIVTVKGDIGVGKGLRQLAALIKLAADFYDGTGSDLAYAAFTVTPWKPSK